MDATADVCVIGAGAAGLWAARICAASGLDTVLLEKTPRTGTKVLASGGTKCNLTTTLGPEDAAALFGQRGERFLRRAFRELSPAAVREWFGAHGVATVEAPLEKIFPASGRAVHVRDALERTARAAGARIRVDARVAGLERRDGGWCIALADGSAQRASRVIVCPGGKSYARTGTTGDGYTWFADLGCELVEPVPALAPLVTDDRAVTELTGIAVQDVVATLRSADRKHLGRRRRPILFTHHGVSGPGAMDLSVHVARAAPPRRFILQLDLVPEHDREQLRDGLIAAARAPGSPRVSRALPVEMPRRLLGLVLARAGIGEDEPRANALEKRARHMLIETLKGLEIPICGTLGFDKAEVTAGGLALTALDPGTMAVRGQPGLFACGEILDLAGPIGGLNFQAAFATAELAGRAVADQK